MGLPPRPAALSRPSVFFDGLAAALIVALAVFDLLGLEQSWDTLAYHLPYAGVRTGILPPSAFVLFPGLQHRFDGFPAFIDWVQGGLWILFGTPKAAALITPLAIAAFAAYARVAFRIGLIWPVLIFLAVPILQTALNAAYVDLWTNAFFSIHLLAAWRSLHPGGRDSLKHGLVSLLALAVAANSKEQFYVVGAVSYGLYLLLLAWRAPSDDRYRKILAAALVLWPAIFAGPLRNWIVLGNPIYPMSLPLLSLHGPEAPYFTVTSTIRHLPQFVRFLLSMLDSQALDYRVHGYSIDQGEAEQKPGWHMGGSCGLLVVATLATLAIALRRARLTRGQAAAASCFALLAAAVANFPGSNELRYFSFIEIVPVFATLALLRSLAAPGNYAAGLQTGYRITLAASFVFTAFVTGFTHLQPYPNHMKTVIARHPEVEPELLQALARSDTVCYARPLPYGILYVELFHPEAPRHPYRVVEEDDPAACPAGSAVLR